MPDVRQILLHILDSVPSDYFDDLKPTEVATDFMKKTLNQYVGIIE